MPDTFRFRNYSHLLRFVKGEGRSFKTFLETSDLFSEEKKRFTEVSLKKINSCEWMQVFDMMWRHHSLVDIKLRNVMYMCHWAGRVSYSSEF